MPSLNSSPQSRTAPEVALVFPPLVEGNFGTYYPSTAVLAGYLSARGIGSLQTDMNEDFATYLLETEHLEHMAKGRFGEGLTLSPSSLPSVAARLIARHRNLLLDEQGKHWFREDSSYISHLLNVLIQPYRIDLPLSIMATPGFYDQPQAVAYQTFFEHLYFARTLPANIHTVGISIPTGTQLAPALILGRHLKTLRPELAIILGGPTISLMSLADVENMLSCNPAIDAFVRFDGEHPLETLLEQRRSGSWEPAKVPGVSCLVGTEIVHHPPEAGPDLDSVSYAEYDAQLLSRLAKPEIGIVQSRGCYWGRCEFCDYVVLYQGSPRFRTRMAKSFVDEMEYQIQRHSVYQFSVITEALAPAFAAKISQLILQRGLRVKWHSYAMVDRHFTPELFKTMVNAGCEYLVVGLETMTDRVLHLVNKAATKEDNIRFSLDARAAGLDIKVDLIADLPTTTFQEAMDSLATLRKIQECFSWVAYFPFEVTRSSRIGREPERFGLHTVDSNFTPGQSWQSYFAQIHLEVLDPAMTADERKRVIAECRAFEKQVNTTEVNSRETRDTPAAVVPEDTIQNARFRLAEEFLDITPVEGGVQYYHWPTRKKFRFPQELSVVIEKVRSIQPFRPADFIRYFSPISLGEYHFNELLEIGILTVYKPPNRKTGI